MGREPANYLATLCKCDSLSLTDLPPHPPFKTGLVNYWTANPVHADQIAGASKKLKEHFDKKKPLRPLTNLILGPAGSGKSYLAKQFKEVTKAALVEVNLSQCERPADIRAKVDEVGALLEHEQNVIAFFDEFDVRVGGVSAVQFLIQPTYDATDSEGRDLSRAAFIFSGSYLKNRQIFDSLGGAAQGIDFIGFLYDSYLHSIPEAGGHALLRDFLDLTMKYYPLRQQNPTTNALEYVRSLEKINDFVSRVNGFVVELPDLGAPLDATRERFSVDPHNAQATPDASLASELIELVNGLRGKSDEERFLDYRDPYQPILEYKNLILLDRLQRVLVMLAKSFPQPPVLRIKRSLVGYLATVPLIHGMRSLSSIIESLKPDSRDIVGLGDGHPHLLRRHIADYHYFPSPDALWELVQKGNPHYGSYSGDMFMSVKRPA